jgi:hypothetical protein
MVYTHTHTHTHMYVCMYNISPPLKNLPNKKNGINVFLHWCVIIKNILKIHVIYETYNIVSNILKF